MSREGLQICRTFLHTLQVIGLLVHSLSSSVPSSVPKLPNEVTLLKISRPDTTVSNWGYVERLQFGQFVISTPVAGVAATNPAVVKGDRSGRQDVPNTGADRKPFEVTLNLTQSATRGEKSTNDSQMIRVPARLLECRLTLPLGSSDGLYYVRVQRAAQSEVLKTAQGNATIKHGEVRLDVELDMSTMPAGGYLLSYRHARESWHRVPIVITKLTD